MTRTTCHDPHTEDLPDKLRELGTKAGDHVCQTCHTEPTDHSHHQTLGCVACHMAKKDMGLDYVLNRYHRIGSPTKPVRVERDRPLACALCQAYKSVDALVTTMEQWWGKHYDRAKLRTLYGDDLSVNPLRATLVFGKPHEQAVAITVMGE